MDPIEDFNAQVANNIEQLGRNDEIKRKSMAWLSDITALRYVYNFRWLGRPIIQVPQDVVAIQELIWSLRPDLVIETGIAHGGSLVLSASILALLDYADAIKSGAALDPRATKRRVLGIDIDIREHNRTAIDAHPLGHRIDMIQGSSIDAAVITKVSAYAKSYEKIMVILDSNHTHDHVLSELEAYAPLVSKGSYCLVFDTLVEDMPEGMFSDRPWGKGNNPKTAVWEYLRRLREEGRNGADGTPLEFAIDKAIENKLLLTVAPDGYLRRV